MIRTSIFALYAVLAPQVAVSFGVRLRAIPEAYWGTWAPAAEICQDANKSAIVLSAKAYVTSAVRCAVEYVAETASPKGPYLLRVVAMLEHGRADAEQRSQYHHPARRYQPDFHRSGTASSLINAVPRAVRPAGREALPPRGDGTRNDNDICCTA
jgi:hypothetical protein